MDNEKNDSEHEKLPTNVLSKELSGASHDGLVDGDQRIQFVSTARPDRTKTGGGEDNISIYVAPPGRRPQSIVSIPQVISRRERRRRKSEKDEEEKNVDIDEHLMSHNDVAERYQTLINMEKPDKSLGLTTHQAEELLVSHGPNALTPPARRHPFFKYLDCLFSLFNLLLILSGILEYILLGISFKNNFQNVSTSHFSCPD
jgi:sodium/potassium-transporting ATPase subunit alpha